jgi:maltose/moltooligosaccharide transporter
VTALATRRASTGIGFLIAFGLAAVGVGAARAITTTFVPVLLDRIADAPLLIGVVMLVNALAGFAVPLAVGLWSDRSRSRMGPRLPYVLGGSVLTLGGLLAVALGSGTSYLVLALASALVYAGLNATATAHRALIPDGFEDAGRPAATSSQEVAMLVGAMAGIGAGGVLLSVEPWVPFAVAALLVPLTAAPTVITLLRRGARRWTVGEETQERRSVKLADFTQAMRRPGAREVLIAQVLWVAAYVALPTFFILYAADVLGLTAGVAAAIPAGFGLLTGAAMVAAGRTAPEQVRGRLMLGATLLGAGLLAAVPLSSVVTVAVPFGVAAVGAGLVTALGFPYFARFIPDGMAGRYSGVYFASRAMATVVALPMAGLLVELTGSYRFLLVQGGLALLAPLVLARIEPLRVGLPRAPVRRLAAVVPCYGVERIEDVVGLLHPHAEQIVLVDDGAPCAAAARIDALAGEPGVRVLRLAQNDGKGSAVAAGTELLLACPSPPDAIAVVDADGQHPADRLPDFLAALADADVVIGDRMGDPRDMPWQRRMTNRVSSALVGMVLGHRIHDSQCGMRVFRTEALEKAPPPPGRYEAETRHLKALVRAGQRLDWVPIPAIYGSARSSFRPVRDSARVLGAIFGRSSPARLRRPGAAFWRHWTARLGALVAGTMAVGAAMPLLGPLDERAFLNLNGLGDGPEWLYSALDPHTRNYILLIVAAVAAVLVVRRVALLGAALALLAAAFFSDILLQAVYILYERPRPEEVLGDVVMLSHDRTWAHIASFPSGHLTVTTAIVVAAVALAPVLRTPLWSYVAVVAVTRITFGAHFPADVVVGIVFGYVCGVFSVALVQASGLLPKGLANPSPLPAWLRAPGVRERWPALSLRR